MGRQGRPGERRTERPYGRRINRWFARRPLAGVPVSPASPESPAVFALPRRVSAPSPKHGVRSPPCPLRPPGPDVRLARTHGPPPPRLSFVSFVSFVISKTIWQSVGGSRPLICPNLRNRRFPPFVSSWRPVLRGGPAPPSVWKTRGPTQQHLAARPVFAKLKV